MIFQGWWWWHALCSSSFAINFISSVLFIFFNFTHESNLSSSHKYMRITVRERKKIFVKLKSVGHLKACSTRQQVANKLTQRHCTFDKFTKTYVVAQFGFSTSISARLVLLFTRHMREFLHLSLNPYWDLI